MSCFSHFSQLLILLNRIAESSIAEKTELNSSELTVQKVTDYINENYRNNITLDEAAKMAFTSSAYFSKKFKKTTGFGFSEYITFLRITEAAKLLLNTNKSISEISFLCGFNNSSYFGDVFKRVKGISPQKYRISKGRI